MTILRPKREIQPHEMSHILSDIAQLGPTVWDDVLQELVGVGYLAEEIEQIHKAWKLMQAPPIERTPFTVDVSEFGEGVVTLTPNQDDGSGDHPAGRGIQLALRHEFLLATASILVSVGEADQILFGLDKCIVQTGGESHLDRGAPRGVESLAASLAGDEGLEGGEIYNAVCEAVAVDEGAVREALATMLLALSDSTTSTIPELAFNLANAAIDLDGELER